MGTIMKMAWRNLWRNRRRTLITVASIFFGVLLSAYMTSMQEGTYEKMVDIVVKFYSGYIQIHHEDYWENKSINSSFDYSDSLMSLVGRHTETSSAFPRLESFALASTENLSKGAMVFGIDPEKEDEWSHLSQKIKTGSYLQQGDQGVVIGEGLASYLKLTFKDTLVMIGQGYQGTSAAGKFPVKGIIRHTSPELNKVVVYMDIELCREFLSAPGKITSLVINVKSPGDMKGLLKKLKTEVTAPLAVMSWDEMQPEVVQQIEGDRAGGMIMKWILYMVIGFGILGTMMMMIAERRKEFGVMVAVGMRNRRLSGIIFLETLLIGILGTLTGLIASFPVIFYQAAHPIPFSGEMAELMEQYGFEPYLFFSKSPWIFNQQALTIFVITLFVSIFPVTAILRLKVNKALHT